MIDTLDKKELNERIKRDSNYSLSEASYISILIDKDIRKEKGRAFDDVFNEDDLEELPDLEDDKVDDKLFDMFDAEYEADLKKSEEEL